MNIKGFLFLPSDKKSPTLRQGIFDYFPTKLAARSTELTSSRSNEESCIGDDVADGEVS